MIYVRKLEKKEMTKSDAKAIVFITAILCSAAGTGIIWGTGAALLTVGGLLILLVLIEHLITREKDDDKKGVEPETPWPRKK